MITYSVKLEPQEEGGYTVMVPALPGCISEGDTLEEALENIEDAIGGYLHSLAKHGNKIFANTLYAPDTKNFAGVAGVAR